MRALPMVQRGAMPTTDSAMRRSYGSSWYAATQVAAPPRAPLTVEV